VLSTRSLDCRASSYQIKTKFIFQINLGILKVSSIIRLPWHTFRSTLTHQTNGSFQRNKKAAPRTSQFKCSLKRSYQLVTPLLTLMLGVVSRRAQIKPSNQLKVERVQLLQKTQLTTLITAQLTTAVLNHQSYHPSSKNTMISFVKYKIRTSWLANWKTKTSLLTCSKMIAKVSTN
jgi:hypothetical protein